jgi:hypothetical protein
MFRRILVTIVAVTFGVALLPGTGQAAPPPTVAVQAAPAPVALDPTCQKTFHARPTTGGNYDDPCTFNAGSTPNYSWSIGVKFGWSCTGAACHIVNVFAELNICHRTDDPDTSSVVADAVSLNFWVTKAAFLVFDEPGQPVRFCDKLVSPLVAAKGCGSNDGHLAGVYPQVVSIMARGRGTLFGQAGSPEPDFQRIPGWGLFDSHESYYWLGRQGSCT